MAPSPPRLRILSVGGNAVSAFLSWRLQATTACDVTLVWKNGFEHASTYGISFKSKQFGNERFKPRHVARTPEEGGSKESAFDYVLLCVKALPEVYDLAAIIHSAVTPEHTCILVNTTNTMGIESYLEEKFPTNIVLSLVSCVDLKQTGSSEFEHGDTSEVWVGSANQHKVIPAEIQHDMAEALAMTLGTGQVNCTVSDNIVQQQFEKMLGPIVFYPLSVLCETPNHTQLLEQKGIRELVNDTMDELLALAERQGCVFDADFKEKTIASMTAPTEPSITYQDFLHKTPLEVENLLGAPKELARTLGMPVPRIQTLYALFHARNTINLTKPAAGPVAPAGPQPPQQRAVSTQRPPMGMGPGPMMGAPNGNRGSRAPSMTGPPPPRHMMGPPMNGYPRSPNNGMPPRGPAPQQMARRPSFEDNNLEEFSHLMLYDDVPEVPGAGGMSQNGSYPDLSGMGGQGLSQREQEYMMRQTSGNFRPPMSRGRGGMNRRPQRRPQFDEDEDEDDYVDPMEFRGPPQPMMDPDAIDMMSVTSRRNRKAPSSAQQFRKDPEHGIGGYQGGRPNSSFGRRFGGRGNRASTQLMQTIPGLHDSLMNDPMMGYSSNRYGNVDRKNMQDESRANSLTAGRLQEMGQNQMGHGPYPQPPSRRTSHSPGVFPNGRPPIPTQDSYNNGAMYADGPQPGGRPSPPGMMRAPVPRHPPGQGNAVAPQQVEQHAGRGEW